MGRNSGAWIPTWVDPSPFAALLRLTTRLTSSTSIRASRSASRASSWTCSALGTPTGKGRRDQEERRRRNRPQKSEGRDAQWKMADLYTSWEQGLPKMDELVPISQALLPYDLATAFDLHAVCDVEGTHRRKEDGKGRNGGRGACEETHDENTHARKSKPNLRRKKKRTNERGKSGKGSDEIVSIDPSSLVRRRECEKEGVGNREHPRNEGRTKRKGTTPKRRRST